MCPHLVTYCINLVAVHSAEDSIIRSYLTNVVFSVVVRTLTLYFNEYLCFLGKVFLEFVKSMHLIICFFYASIAVMGAKLKALWNLDEMSICRLGYPATVYNNYGCWCGVGGSGKPMDGIDRKHT
uniref:PA2c domain-containing protein n=1 Tax=Elaeophora elaphi TaxID=1147741 RepID=A0A0R3RSB3_9BILA